MVRKRFVFFVMMAGLGWVFNAFGDVVYLKSGGTLEGTLVDEGANYRVEFQGNAVVVRKVDIDRIERKPIPEAEFFGRLAAAGTDADQCVQAAQWAYARGLQREYVLGLRAALQINRQHTQARRLLLEFCYRQEQLPFNDNALRRLQMDFGFDFQTQRTAHYRIACSGSEMFAEVTAELLEKVYEKFGEFFRQRDFDPAPITDRMEVVLFHTREQFDAWVLAAMPEMRGANGFYSTKTNRAYFFDAFNEGSFSQALEQLQQHAEKIKQTREQVKNAPAESTFSVTHQDGRQEQRTRQQLMDDLDGQEKQLAAEQERVRHHYMGRNVSVTVHEAVHQLAYNCGIHSRFAENPKWIIEGLAVYFEAPTEAWWDGPGQVHPHRLKHFNDAMNQPIRLEELLTNDALFNASDPRADTAYASAWALFYYLAWQQHENLFDYLYALSLRVSAQPYGREERLTDFIRYFGKLDSLEVHWRRTMQALAIAQTAAADD